MGVAVSTPRPDARPEEHREHLIGAVVGSRAYELSSSLWEKLLLLPPTFQWPPEQVTQACLLFAQNNMQTRHLPKLLVHLVWSIREMSTASKSSPVKLINATYFSRVFLKHLIENAKGDAFITHLSLIVSDHEAQLLHLPQGALNVPGLAVQAILSFIGATDINPYTYMLHLELVNLLLVMMSTQLHALTSAGCHPFLDASLMMESSAVGSFVRKLLLSFIAKTPLPSEAAYYGTMTKDNQTGVIRKMSSAAATVFMLPYYTYTYLLSSGGDRLSRYPLADNSLLLLLVFLHYGKSSPSSDQEAEPGADEVDTGSVHIATNPFRLALETSRDTDFDITDVEQTGQGVRIPFAALYDRLGLCLTEDASILLLYSLVHGNPAFLEYVLVRTDLDTLIMPVLEMLYDVQQRTPNQIYMLLVTFLILSQDSTFNASIHKLILPGVPWYKERLLPGISLGSLMVIILIRTVKFNLSKLRDLFLHTNCLAILANMAPHMHQLNAYASQRLVSLFDMLARKYNKVCEASNDVKLAVSKTGQVEGFEASEEVPTELHIYTDFLRIVLEIINAILTYALPRNPEVVYALLHRQELFQPFREHPRFVELLDNIYTVLDFFNVRMDDEQLKGDWSVEKVLQIVIANARSWRGDGMKAFTQLRFTYEEELHPEEFFLPYIWRLVVSHSSNIDWERDSIALFPAEQHEKKDVEALK